MFKELRTNLPTFWSELVVPNNNSALLNVFWEMFCGHWRRRRKITPIHTPR